MSFAKSYPVLAKTFAVSALGLGLTGCMTAPPLGECQTFLQTGLFAKVGQDKDCATGKFAETLSQSSDEGERVMAQHIRESLDARVKAAADRTRDEAVEKTAPYKVSDVEVKDGRKIINLAPVKKAPSATP